MALDVICSGFLIDVIEKKSKKKWYLLKDLFLFEYEDQPAEGKNTSGLKGLYYLPSCTFKDEESSDHFVLLTASNTEKRLGAGTEPEPDKYILSWKNSLEYVIKKSQAFKTEYPSVVEGWLKKRGGLGHQHKNQKSRHFVLQGNILSYYSDVRKNEDDITGLKGFIEVSSITKIAEVEGKALDFSVLTNGGKEYIMTAKDTDEKRLWMDALNTCIHTCTKHSFPVAMDVAGTKETVIKTGKLSRLLKGKPVPNWFALSNMNLRFYTNEITPEALEKDIGCDCLGTIPLVGVYVRNDPNQGILTIFDIGGNAYALSSKEKDELRKWEEVITAAAKSAAQRTVHDKRLLRMNCFLLPENTGARSKGYCIVIASRNELKFNFLMLKKEISVRMKHLKSLDMADDDLLAIRYKKDNDDLKQLNLKCKNASGIFDTLEALFEMYTEDPPSDDEREEKQRREQEAKANKEKLKSSQPKKRKKTASVSSSKRPSINEARPALPVTPEDLDPPADPSE